jgi:hypothetical protein
MIQAIPTQLATQEKVYTGGGGNNKIMHIWGGGSSFGTGGVDLNTNWNCIQLVFLSDAVGNHAHCFSGTTSGDR